MLRVFALRLSLAIAVFFIAISTAQAQISVNSVVLAEFFDDILQVHPGTVTDVFDIAQSDNITNLAVADSTTIYVNNFTEIWEIDLLSGTVTTLATVNGSPRDITMDLDGSLLICTPGDGILSMDPATGALTTVFEDSFFGPSDICVSAEGFIYTTEFFDGLGRIDILGNWTKLGDWDTNFFQHIDIGPDGFLYCATTFEDGDIYRVSPITGYGEKIADNVYTFIDDLQVDPSGNILIAGNTDIDGDELVEDVVLSIDPANGAVTIVVDETQVGDPSPPFFNPMDIEIFDDVFYVSGPGLYVPQLSLVNRGTFVSGDDEALAQSDNVDYSVTRNLADIQSITEVEVATISGESNPSQLQMTVEASVFARSPVTQQISLFNFDSGSYETIDSQNAQRFTDKVVVVDASGDLSRFVQNGTNQVRARIRFESVSQRQQFRSDIDRVLWTID
ncbi:MAG: hypothetical protein AAF456_19905 [Planctomycetota bacterium]